MMKRLCVNDRDVRLRRLPKDIVIFGAGQDGQNWQRQYREELKIHYFLDNGTPSGCTKQVDEVPVYNAAEKIAQGNLYHILVLSRDYQDEMCAQLKEAGLVAGQDFHVWEWRGDLDLEHVYAFIEHNRQIWGKESKQRKSRKILCTMYWHHCADMVFTSYYGNVLAQKYDAEIIGASIKWPINYPFACEVYNSFHAKGFLPMVLSECQQKRVEELFDKIWPTLHTKNDWQAIEIDGINFGHEIYREYLRYVAGIFNPEKYEMDMRKILKQALRIIVYYKDYFSQNDVRAVTMTDGLYEEGYVRIIAWHYGAKVYAIDWGRVRYYPPGQDGLYVNNLNYPEIFNRLSAQEQEDGLLWAKKTLKERLGGATTEISSLAVSPWAQKQSTKRLLDENEKLKIVIVPHSIIDDAYPYGRFMFADHEDWLRFLGEMSERTDYDWYIKYHPIAGQESIELWDDIVKRYPKIKKLPINSSPKQLKEEGIKFALTLWGSCGYEYPLLGIQVIAAGPNPYGNYNFCWQAHTLEEYERMLLHLPEMYKQIDVEEIYQFYCVHFRYAIPPWWPVEDIFYPKRQMYTYNAPQPLRLNMYGRLEGYKDNFGEWQYRWFIDEFSPEFHQKLMQRCKDNIEMATAAAESH
ncbi:hypothetical protein [Selenomonas ruminantium]|uniref:Capsule polysaccharide biosynthesis protein n=1 Tax=Selenomonas ruminantium TaxID=971 RepID=A0A1K1N9Q4_SELRU|nr:hypothetical protein [Selenomonas ruminantium]SFW31989.1 hypothetical protein SAMN02910323_1285 [Selenomonas ruminantium]